eukprot:5620289-Pleurochrysis_carterae.AAC.3
MPLGLGEGDEHLDEHLEPLAVVAHECLWSCSQLQQVVPLVPISSPLAKPASANLPVVCVKACPSKSSGCDQPWCPEGAWEREYGRRVDILTQASGEHLLSRHIRVRLGTAASVRK